MVAGTTAAERKLKGSPAHGTRWTQGKKRGAVGSLGGPAIPPFLRSLDTCALGTWSVPTSAPGIWDSSANSGQGLPPTWRSSAVGGRERRTEGAIHERGLF